MRASGSASLRTATTTEQLVLFSGGEIVFDSASQLVTTNAKCGLIPQLIDNIRD